MNQRPVYVRFKNVCRYFDEAGRTLTVLENATCEIYRGEVVALLGRSGSGKSTVLNLIAGIDVCDRGDIEVGDMVLGDVSETQRTLFRRRELGFVFQSFNLVPTLKVGENVELPLALLKVDDAERTARTRNALREVGLDDRADAYPENLSGGERQRIAVARALIHRPSLILADEPTGNLDDENAEGVLDLLVSMSRERGATLIMATHSTDAADRGAAVVVAVDTASDSVRRGFEISAETVNGRATHHIVGRGEGVDTAVYAKLRKAGIQAVPLITGIVTLNGASGFRIIGIDALADTSVRAHLRQQVDVASFGDAGELTVTMTSRAATAAGMESGDIVDLELASRRTPVRLSAIIEPTESVYDEGLARSVITDIALAQHVLGTKGRLSRIDIVASDDDPVLRLVERLLPPGVQLLHAESQSAAQRDMVRSLETNLAALGLLALLIGVFLIYNTMTFSVVRRRQTIGMLRAIGATRLNIASRILLEAALLGAAASFVGIALGLFLAKILTALTAQTVNDLYFETEITSLSINVLSLIKAWVLGVTATVVAAVLPAVEATRTLPRAALSRADLETRAGQWSRWALGLGVAATVISVLLLVLPGGHLLPAFAGLFFLIVGVALMIPLLVPHLVRLMLPVIRRVGGMEALMGARYITRSTSRTGVAVAALAVAVSATMGVGIMISSFRISLIDWLETRLRADVYVSAQAGETLAPSLVARLGTLEGVSSVGYGNWTTLVTESGPVMVFALQTTPRGFASYVKDNPEEHFAAFDTESVVYISEPFSYRRGLDTDDRLTLPTDSGDVRFQVGGVYKDYRSDRGVVLMSRNTWMKHFNDPSITAIGLTLEDAENAGELRTRVAQLTPAQSAFEVVSNRDLKQASIQIFDRTFAVTNVLRLLAVIVAAIGIVSALMALQFERARDFAVLRAVGLTPVQVAKLASVETLCMGIASGLFAVPLGLLTAWILVHVVNRRSFGWTMDFVIDPTLVVQGIALAIGAALAAGILPTLRILRQTVATNLRNE